MCTANHFRSQISGDFSSRKSQNKDRHRRQLSKQHCDEKIIDALKMSESVVEGIKEWHRFVIQRVNDGDPCPICYSYYSSDAKQVPSVKCGTCGQIFHKTCLKKWFDKCLYRTCPACATRWKEARK